MTKRMCVLVLALVLATVLVLPSHTKASPLDGLLDGATDWLDDQTDKATDWASDQVNKATDEVNKQVDNATDWASQQAGKASDWAQGQSSQIQSWAQQQTSAVVEKAQGLADSANQLVNDAGASLRAAGITPQNISAYADAVATVVSDPKFQEAVVITVFKNVPMWDPEQGRVVTFDTAMRGVMADLDDGGYMAGSDIANDPVAFGVLVFMDDDYMLSKARIWQNPDGSWTTLNAAVAAGSPGASGTRSSYYRARSSAQSGDNAGFTSALQGFSSGLGTQKSATTLEDSQNTGESVSMWVKRDLSAAVADRWVSFRSGPGIDYTRMARIPQETRVDLLGVEAGAAGDGWAYVRYNGQYGYTWAAFLTATNPAGDTAQRSVTVWLESGSLMLTKPAGTTSTGVQADEGSEVELLDFASDAYDRSWARVTYQGATGFVEAAIVTPKPQSAAIVSTSVGMQDTVTSSSSLRDWLEAPGGFSDLRGWIARSVLPYAGWWVAGLLSIVLLLVLTGQSRRRRVASQ